MLRNTILYSQEYLFEHKTIKSKCLKNFRIVNNVFQSKYHPSDPRGTRSPPVKYFENNVSMILEVIQMFMDKYCLEKYHQHSCLLVQCTAA